MVRCIIGVLAAMGWTALLPPLAPAQGVFFPPLAAPYRSATLSPGLFLVPSALPFVASGVPYAPIYYPSAYQQMPGNYGYNPPTQVIFNMPQTVVQPPPGPTPPTAPADRVDQPATPGPRIDEIKPSGKPGSAELPGRSTGRAHLDVTLPAGAELWFDGKKINLTGTHRSFEVDLQKGLKFSCELRAVWQEQGRSIQQKRLLTLQAGETVQVEFKPMLPAQGTAAQR